MKSGYLFLSVEHSLQLERERGGGRKGGRERGGGREGGGEARLEKRGRRRNKYIRGEENKKKGKRIHM